MAQLTIRIDDALAADLKAEAARTGVSVNRLVEQTVRARVDPEAAGEEVERIRQRLRRAGLLAEPSPYDGPRVGADEFERARAAAGSGTPVSDLIGEGRGRR